MTRTQLLENFLTVRGIVDDRFLLHVPAGPILLVARLREAFFCHESHERFRRIKRHQAQMLRFRKDDQRLIGFKRASPVLSPSDLTEKILTGQVVALDIAVQQGLTLPTEHFHGHDWTTACPRKAVQKRQGRLDVKAVMMLFTQVDNLLLKQAAYEFFNGNRLFIRRIDDLPGSETGRRLHDRTGRGRGLSSGAGD